MRAPHLVRIATVPTELGASIATMALDLFAESAAAKAQAQRILDGLPPWPTDSELDEAYLEEPWGLELAAAVLSPCLADRLPVWAPEVHDYCTGGHHVGPGVFVRCACSCHAEAPPLDHILVPAGAHELAIGGMAYTLAPPFS